MNDDKVVKDYRILINLFTEMLCAVASGKTVYIENLIYKSIICLNLNIWIKIND